MNDIEFTFDTASFKNAIDAMSKGILTFNQNVLNFGKQIEQSVTTPFKKMQPEVEKAKDTAQTSFKNMREGFDGISAWMIAKGTLLADVIKNVFNRAVGFIKGGIPEIGKTFEIVSDILQRNFLWPLRQELAPMLQNILNWFRDNRARFVQWGGHLVNIFRVIKTAVGAVWDVMKSFAKGFSSTWTSAFGKTSKSLSDFFYMLTFKVAATVIFIKALVTPLFESIGRAIGFIAVGIKGLIDGIIEGASTIVEPLSEIVKMLSEFINELVGGEKEAQGFYKIMKTIGDFIGTTLVVALNAVAMALRGVIDLVRSAIVAFKIFFKSVKGDTAGVEQEVQKLFDIWKKDVEFQKKSMDKMSGAIDKSVERTQKRFSESETEIKPKISPQTKIENKQSNNLNNNVNVNIAQLKVETKDNSKEIINGVSNELGSQVRQQIMNDLMLQGATT